MADPLAEQLNRISAQPQTAPVTPAPAAVAEPSLWKRMGDYISNTNVGDLANAFGRLNPLTMPAYLARDAAQGKLIENQRILAGNLSQIPTDVVGGVVGLYPGISAINTLATGAAPWAGAKTLGTAADAIRDFGRSYGDVIAGQPLGDPDLLRGTDAQMAGRIARFIPTLVTPVPSAVSVPLINAISKVNLGSQMLNKAGELGLKTLEAMTPLAVSAQVTPKIAAINAAVGTPMAVAGEAAGAAMLEKIKDDARQKGPTAADAAMEQETKQVHAATDAMLQGTDQAGVTGKPKPVIASISTGSDVGDALVVGGIGAAALLSSYKRDAIRKAANNINSTWQKATTSYDPARPDEVSQQSWGTKFRQQHFYDAASQEMTQYNIRREAGDTPAQAREFIREQNELRSKRQGASASMRKSGFETRGEFVDSTIKLKRPMDDHAIEVGALDQPGRNNYNTYLHYKNELANRENSARAIFGSPGPWGQRPGGPWGTPTPTGPWGARPIAHNLPDISTDEMKAFIRGIDASEPHITKLANEYKEMIDKLGQYMGEQGRLNKSNVALFQRENPNYVPPNVADADSLIDPKKARTYNKDTKTYEPRGALNLDELGDPLALLARYSDEVFRSTEGKKVQRDFINFLHDSRAKGSKIANDMLGREVQLDPVSNKKTVHWRDADGNSRHTEINDAVVRNSLKGMTSPSALQLTRGMMSTLARWSEAGSVGAPSLIGGQFFAPKAMTYAGTAGATLSRPPGVSIGWGDVGVRKLTGALLGKDKAFGMRGDVLGLAADLAYRVPRNIVDVSTYYGGAALHNSVLRNGWLANAVGPKTAERWAKSMKDQFETTMTFDHQKRGLMGPAAFDSVDRAKLYQDPTGAYKVQGAPAMTYNYLQDVLHAISSAPGMSVRAMNKGLPDWKVDSAIRNLAGDPGRSGAFRKAGGAPGVNAIGKVVGATPWGNVFLQSNYKLFGSLLNVRDPGEATKVALTLATGVTLPAVSLTMWNASLGPEYSEYQYHTRTPEKRASSFYIGIPGLAPQRGVEIPIDPGLRPIKQIGEIIAGHMLGAYSGELFTDENKPMREAMGDAVGHRDWSISKNSAMRAAIFQSIVPPVPTVVEAAVAFYGGEVRDYGDVRFKKPDRKGGFSESETGDPRAGIMGNSIVAQMEDVLQAIGGTAADATISYVHGVVKDLRDGRGFGETAAQVGREWAQRAKDSTDILGSGPLLDNARGLTPSTAASTVLAQQKNAGMTEIVNAVTSSTDKGVPKGDMMGNKKAGYSYSIGQGPAAPPDQATIAFSQRVQEYKKELQPSFSEVSRLYDELSRIRNDSSFKPEERRAYQEVVAGKIIEKNKAILADQRRYEATLSQQFGVQVKFDTFNRNESVMTQYPPLYRAMQGR